MNAVKINQDKAKKTGKFAKTLIAASVLTLVAAPIAVAKKYHGGYNNTTYDHARVVGVDPIFETYQVNEPIRQCWDERVAIRDEYHDDYNRGYRKNKSKTPEILGAIIGGVVGNQIGKRGGGNARDVATVAGAVLGGSIGRDVKHKNHHKRHNYHGSQRYETVERCEVQDNYVTKQEIVGYDVAYKYRGKVFHTQMAHDPGSKIKVKVTVNPV